MSSKDFAYPHNKGLYAIHGLTKRELIAAMAMQGLLGSEVVHRYSDHVRNVIEEFHRAEWFARQAAGFADALLAELAKEPQA